MYVWGDSAKYVPEGPGVYMPSRMRRSNSLGSSDKAACPRCGIKTSPVKTWKKLAGTPTKTGERLQLTMAYYKCSKCNKTF